MRFKKIQIITIVFILSSFLGIAGAVPVRDKVAVLITSWGSPAGYNFEYSWNSHAACRIGDRTLYPGQPCKIGHIGEFPYESHLGLMPWALGCSWPGWELSYDRVGVYQLVNGVYISIYPEEPSLTPDLIPAGVPITPVGESISLMTGELEFPPDPRTGEDTLPGWYQIGSLDFPFTNGLGDLYEKGPLGFLRRFAILGGPTKLPDAYLESSYALDIFKYTKNFLEEAFGNSIDVRFGMYNKVTGYTEHESDVAEDFAVEGFRKMVLARETTDNNNYANNFLTGNFIKERLCEIGVLNEMEIYHTRQVGRTPEFNSMNIMNLKKSIETYPEGSKIGIIYVTRGLPWGGKESSGAMGTQHPWSKEVYHENAYLNYLSWKKAVQREYGDRYDLVFTVGGVESDMLTDNYFTYGLYLDDKLGDHFHGIRPSIQSARENGLDKMIIAPCHWFFDSMDNLLLMRELNGLPVLPKEEMEAGRFDLTYCEDSEGNEVVCGSQNSAAEITIAPSFSHFTREFATGYYVVLRGTLERFGLYPKDARIKVEASKMVTKKDGGTVEAGGQFSLIRGAKIEIPADPYPDRPEGFTYETAIPIDDPQDTNDCLWEDTVITIGHQLNPPRMKNVKPIGPAVHFGPYRSFFNRDVTITIPYNSKKAGAGNAGVYIYNHVTEDWDVVDVDSADQTAGLVTFKTQVSGLFMAGLQKL